MKVQTRGEFEASMDFNPLLGCFVFLHYKGKWVQSIAKNDGYKISYFHFGSSTSVYLAECILKVWLPEPPHKQQTYFHNFETKIRKDQKEKCFKAMNSETVKCFSSVSIDYKEIEKAIMEAD